MIGSVVAVARDPAHRFSKQLVPSIDVVAGLGIEGDAHQGRMVQHRSRVVVDPSQPNLRQVHLIQSELFGELRQKGFAVGAGDLGENVCTSGIDLLALPTGTLLRIGSSAVLEVTGLRNPCVQIDGFQPGLLGAVLGRGPDNEVVRKAGVMAIVRLSGRIAAGDLVRIELPPPPHRLLERV